MGTIKQKMFFSKAFILQILTISAFLVVLTSAQILSSTPECKKESFCLECNASDMCSKCATGGRYIDQQTKTCRRKVHQSWAYKCKYYAINKTSDSPSPPDCWQCEDNLKWLNVDVSSAYKPGGTVQLYCADKSIGGHSCATPIPDCLQSICQGGPKYWEAKCNICTNGKVPVGQNAKSCVEPKPAEKINNCKDYEWDHLPNKPQCFRCEDGFSLTKDKKECQYNQWYHNCWMLGSNRDYCQRC